MSRNSQVGMVVEGRHEALGHMDASQLEVSTVSTFKDFVFCSIVADGVL